MPQIRISDYTSTHVGQEYVRACALLQAAMQRLCIFIVVYTLSKFIDRFYFFN